MKFEEKTQSLLLNLGLLLLIGIIILAGVSSHISQQKHGSSSVILFKQIFLSIIPGLLAGFWFYAKKNLDFLKIHSVKILAISYLLMLVVFLPFIGLGANGANRWINLGITTFQPSEMFKIACIIYFAYFLSERKIKTLRESFMFFLWLVLMLIPVLLQRDLSTFIVLTFSILAMYFCSEVKLKNILFVIGICVAFVTLFVIIEPYRLQRLVQMQNPEVDPLGKGYHINQSFITLGSGGFAGVGLGMSQQKFGSLPQPMTDSIFAIIGEEMGFLGCLTLIGLYLWFIYQGYDIGKRRDNIFEKMLAIGITSWIGIQTMINIASIVGLLPVTGLPLPFISSGGTAMLFMLAACGILLNISKKIL